MTTSTSTIWWWRPPTAAPSLWSPTSRCRPILSPNDHCQCNLIIWGHSPWGWTPRGAFSPFCSSCQFEPEAKPPPSTRVVLMVGEVVGLSRSLPRFSPRWWWRRGRRRRRRGWWRCRCAGWSFSLQILHCLLLWYVHLQNPEDSSTGFACGT